MSADRANHKVPLLYHGTVPEHAEALMRDGWEPGKGFSGANRGQPRYLYLTDVYENALWFAQEKGSETVLELRDVPLSSLAVDPEDGTGNGVAEELSGRHGLPGYLVLTKPLPAVHFARAAFPSPRR